MELVWSVEKKIVTTWFQWNFLGGSEWREGERAQVQKASTRVRNS